MYIRRIWYWIWYIVNQYLINRFSSFIYLFIFDTRMKSLSWFLMKVIWSQTLGSKRPLVILLFFYLSENEKRYSKTGFLNRILSWMCTNKRRILKNRWRSSRSIFTGWKINESAFLHITSHRRRWRRELRINFFPLITFFGASSLLLSTTIKAFTGFRIHEWITRIVIFLTIPPPANSRKWKNSLINEFLIFLLVRV